MITPRFRDALCVAWGQCPLCSNPLHDHRDHCPYEILETHAMRDIIEQVSDKVHENWMASKRAAGVTTRKLESGEELMVPYADLSEQAKELDRGTVRTVLDVLPTVGFTVVATPCPKCGLPADGPGLAFTDGTICNEPRHVGSTPQNCASCGHARHTGRCIAVDKVPLAAVTHHVPCKCRAQAAQATCEEAWKAAPNTPATSVVCVAAHAAEWAMREECSPAALGVLLEIAEERSRQDQQWGGPKHDDTHRAEDWRGFRRAFEDRAYRGHPTLRRDALVKIAALAVAQIESLDRIAARDE